MAQTKIKAGLFEGIIGNGTDGYFLMSNGDGTMTWAQPITPPSISSIDYPGAATAADPAGGETITINGADFSSGATVTIGGTSAPAVSYVSATQITFTTPAKSAGDYDIVVTNADGGSATFVNGISYNGIPAWTTAAGSLGTFASGETISTITLQATEPDAGTITFNITNGALPTGLSLTGANIDGTTSILNADTLYTFTVTATDDESQATPRTFTITVQKEFLSVDNFTINTYTGNGSTQSIEGKIGTAASFNGSNSKILTGSGSDPIPSSGAFSLSAWVKTTSSNSCFISFGDFWLKSEYTSGVFGLGDVNTTERGTTDISDGSWHHCVLTVDASNNITLYVDGTSEFTGTKSISRTNGGDFAIGVARTSNPVYYWLGNIDQVRVFNKELSSSEVTTLYGESNTSTTKSTTDIFDDGSGVALYEFEKGAIDTGGTSGYIGSGSIFNGSSSRIDKTSVSGFPTGNNSRSISLWVYNQNTVTAGIIGYGNSSTGQSFYLYLDAQGELGVYGYLYNYDSNYTLPTNQWVHLVITHDGTTTRVYANGTEQFNLARTFNTGTNSFRIGGVHWNNSGEFFNGKIDQVRIFNKALSSSEITTLYGETSASATKSTTDIFDDGSGVALYELEGNANDTGEDYGTSAIDSGQSAVFNGSNGVIDLGSNLGLANNSFSFSLWVANRGTTAHSYFIGGGTQTNNQGLHVGYRYNTGKFTLAFYANDLDSNTSMSTDGTWEHWACTYDASTNSRKIYYNGVLDASDTASADFQSTANIKLGLDAGNTYAYGELDDIRIYSDVLTDYEIKRIVANDTANIPTSNLTAHYKLDGNANDETGTYNGTPSNITYSTPAVQPGVVAAYNGTATNVSYAYDGTPTNVNFVGTSFQPDFVLTKSRSFIEKWNVFDSARGATKRLYPNGTHTEATQADSLTSFDSYGWSIGAWTDSNTNGEDFVSYALKGGGATTLNENGSINSQVSANQDAGFSIVTWTGTYPSTGTVGHGLLQTPELFIIKARSSGTFQWLALETLTNTGGYFSLSDSFAASRFNAWLNNQAPTSSTIPLGGYNYVNEGNMLMYCFHSVDGHQKIGTYSGTGQPNNDIYTGFKPRFVMIKSLSSAQSWNVVDSIRNPSNPANLVLQVDSSGVESSSANPAIKVDFDATGFSLVAPAGTAGEGQVNASGSTYMYLAIA